MAQTTAHMHSATFKKHAKSAKPLRPTEHLRAPTSCGGMSAGTCLCHASAAAPQSRMRQKIPLLHTLERDSPTINNRRVNLLVEIAIAK